MSADLETRIRAALRDIPEPEGLGARLRAGTLAGLGDAPAPRRRWRPHLGRGLRWGGGLVAAGAVAALVAVLFIAIPSDPPAGTAGSQGGLASELRAIPTREGLSGEEAAEDLAVAIRARAEANGWRGVTAETHGDGVTLTIEGTREPGWVAAVADQLNLSVFDAGSVIASGPVDDLASAAREAVPGDGPEAYYVVVPARPADGMPDRLDGPFGSRPQAEEHARGLASGEWRGARVEVVPAQVTLAHTTRAEGHLALNDPVLRPGDITSARDDGDVVTLTVAQDTRSEVAARLEGAPRDAFTVAYGDEAWPARLLDYDAATGAMRVRTNVPDPVVGADVLVVVEALRVVPAEPGPGRAVDALPPALVDTATYESAPALTGSARLALSTGYTGEAYDVYTWVTTDGLPAIGVTGGTRLAGDCELGPVSPSVSGCLGAETRDGSAFIFLGRVREGVDSVRIVYPDGSALTPGVANGVVLMFLPREKGLPVGVEALDATGGVIETIDPRDPDIRAGYGG